MQPFPIVRAEPTPYDQEMRGHQHVHEIELQYAQGVDNATEMTRIRLTCGSRPIETLCRAGNAAGFSKRKVDSASHAQRQKQYTRVSRREGLFMGKEYQEIDSRIRRWMDAQRLFFVATAPSGADGLLNCSPKGMDALRVLDGNTMIYGDVGGSGIETVAHLRENGRIVIMLCAFEGPPKIFRFYGKGSVLEPGEPGFEEFATHFEHLPTLRNVIRIDVERIRDSCGYGVPMYRYDGERDSLTNWVKNKSESELKQYRRDNNLESLDGLPGLRMIS